MAIWGRWAAPAGRTGNPSTDELTLVMYCHMCFLLCHCDLSEKRHVAGLVIFNNNMYVATGNGGYDPSMNQYGDSVLRLSLPDLTVRSDS